MSHENMPAHVRACLDAIDSIGGDPATVGELVNVVKRVMGRFQSGNGIPVETAVIKADSVIVEAARAVLAKLPENSND